MLWVLVKKQLLEVFRNYFYDAKKNRMRSPAAIAAYFVLFVVILVGVLGGMFTGLALTLCGAMTSIGMGWLYFLIMAGLAILLGAFGSVFNSYASLYLAKDNDLLLSMPIPVRTVVAARLVNVYLLGAMYSAVALLPALIVHWVVAGATAANGICGILLLIIVTVIVLLLSCVLGWVVAKLSLRLKNKSFVTVFIALVCVAAYYFFYFRANELLQNILLNAEIYGERIRGAAYGLYLFGSVGEGSWPAAAICLAVTAVLAAAVWILLSRSFLKIATAGGNTANVRYIEKRAREKSAFGALLGKELGRFTASPNYMLNCGLGVLLLPICGILLLVKGRVVFDALNEVFANMPDAAAVLICTALCLLSTMNDMASPAVSLEGKSLWIPQSLPIAPKTVLRAKASLQLVLTGIPMLVASVCAAIMIGSSLPVRVLMVVTPLLYTAFSAAFNTVIGVRMPVLTWTNELAPIKQSATVAIALFGGWGVCAVFGAAYLIIGHVIGAAPYLLIWAVLLAAAGLILMRRLDTKCADAFAAL